MSTDRAVFDIDSLSTSDEDNPIVPVVAPAAVVAGTKRKQQSPADQTQRKGRPLGSKKWTEANVDSLLDIIEEKLPTGAKHWEEVSSRLYEEFKIQRNKNACQQKFFRLADVDKPTGSTFIPRHVARAKDIKDKIDAAEVVGLVARNDSASSLENNNDDDSREKALKGSRLMNDDGSLRRPKTKKHKADDMAQAITNLGSQQDKSTDVISSALKSMAEAIVSKTSDGVDDLRMEVAGIQTKLDLLLEKLNK